MLLSVLIFMPLLFALIVAILPEEKWIRPVSFVLSLVHFAMTCLLFYRFNPASSDLQLVEKVPGCPPLESITLWGLMGSRFGW